MKDQGFPCLEEKTQKYCKVFAKIMQVYVANRKPYNEKKVSTNSI